MISRNVPYLAEEAIERDAEALLAEFSQARGVDIGPPVPIEDIVEKHLKLSIEFNNTHDLFGISRSGLDLSQGPDILGAIFFDDKRIVIDESLDPEENLTKEGRYRFTLAHEGGGHWRLHRQFFASDSAQPTLFGGKSPRPVICRLSQAKERAEWQADFYASCLLMPRKLVFAAWEEMYSDRQPRVIAPETSVEHPFAEVRRPSWRIAGYYSWMDSVEDALDRIAQPFAQKFLVSPIAMRIRLETLGLLMREVPHQLILGAN